MKHIDTSEPRRPGAADLNLLILPQECWRPFEVDNQRKSERVWEREIERIPAWIRSGKYPDWISVRIYDYSNSGFGIHYQYVSGFPFSAYQGEEVDLKIAVPCAVEFTVPC